MLLKILVVPSSDSGKFSRLLVPSNKFIEHFKSELIKDRQFLVDHSRVFSRFSPKNIANNNDFVSKRLQLFPEHSVRKTCALRLLCGQRLGRLLHDFLDALLQITDLSVLLLNFALVSGPELLLLLSQLGTCLHGQRLDLSDLVILQFEYLVQLDFEILDPSAPLVALENSLVEFFIHLLDVLAVALLFCV